MKILTIIALASAIAMIGARAGEYDDIAASIRQQREQEAIENEKIKLDVKLEAMQRQIEETERKQYETERKLLELNH